MCDALVITQVKAFTKNHEKDIQVREYAASNKGRTYQGLVMCRRYQEAGTTDEGMMYDVHSLLASYHPDHG